MGQQLINVGSAANDGTGDPLRTAFGKCNDNFSELYAIPPPQGRLSLTTGSPISIAVSAATSINYTPYLGCRVPLWNGSKFEMAILTGDLTGSATDTTKNPAAIGASKVNDWFIWDDAGIKRLGHGPDWTSTTARSAGTALVRQNGILLNSVAITNGPGASRGTYVGTTFSWSDSKFYWTFGGAASGGTLAQLNVWNTYNRVLTSAKVTDSGASYTYASSTYRSARAGNMAIYYVRGLAEEPIVGTYIQRIDLAAAGNVAAIGIGNNISTAPVSPRTFVFGAVAGHPIVAVNHAEFVPDIGAYGLFGIENSDVGTNTFNAESNSALWAHVMA